MKKVLVHLTVATLVLILGLAAVLVPVMDGTAASDLVQVDGGKSGVVQPVVVRSIKSGTSPPLRDLAAVGRALGVGPMPEGPQGGRGAAGQDKQAAPESLGQPAPAGLLTPDLSFDGATQADNINLIDLSPEVPDASLAVGPNHVVQMTNLTLKVFNKSGGLTFGPVLSSSIWSSVGPPCEADYTSDHTNAPTVLYDHLAHRWVFSQFASSGTGLSIVQGPFYECIAVSQTADPAGPYNAYVFTVGGDSDCSIPPYCARNGDPRLGLWPDGYYMASPQIRWDGTTLVPAGQGVAVFNRDEMLSGALSARKVYFDLASVVTPLQPSDLDGPAAAGTPNYYLAVQDGAFSGAADSLNIYQFHVDWAAPANSTFGPSLVIDTSSSPPLLPFTGANPETYSSQPCSSGLPCIPQPGTTTQLGSLAHRIMSPVQYRDFGTYRTMIANHTVDGDGTGRAGIRWYELRDSGGGWSIFQQGTYAPGDGESRWLGSAAMNGNGDIAVGFNASSSSTFPSLRYAGRQAADPAGLLSQGEGVIVAGNGSRMLDNPNGQNFGSRHLWGEYSTLVVDPSDDRTFWYTGEYHQATSDDNWRTRIGSFQVPPDTGATVAIQGGTTVDTGSIFTLDIVVNSGTALDIGVAQVYLDFDPNYLQVVDSGDPSGPLVPGLVFGSAWNDAESVIQNSADNTTGQISFAGGKGLTGTDVQTPFVLAQVQFRAVAPTPSQGTDLTFNMAVPRRTRAVSGISDVTSTATGATVHVADSAAPVASDDEYSVPEGTILDVGAASGVLSNDTHPDGSPLSAVLVSGPSNGALTLNSDGSFTYTSSPGFVGVDTFTYQASDGVTSSNEATVTVTVLLSASFTADLQGRPLPPHSSWILGFTVDLYAPGADPNIIAPLYSYNVASDLSGSLVLDVTPGVYDIRAKGDNTLRILAPGVDLTSSLSPAVALGTQIGGDSNKDNAVGPGDYSEVVAAFGDLVSALPANLKATDHNGDGIVDIADYGIVVTNFNRAGVGPAG